MRAGGL